jgi:hypothetical protein
MEMAVKLRLLLTSAPFLFAQSPTTQVQETLDLAKISRDDRSRRSIFMAGVSDACQPRAICWLAARAGRATGGRDAARQQC